MITQPPAQAQSDAERAYLGKPQELIQRARQEARPRGIVGGQGNQPMLPERTGILAAANDFLEIMAANNREQSKGIPETPDLSTKILNSFEQFFTQNTISTSNDAKYDGATGYYGSTTTSTHAQTYATGYATGYA